MKKLIIFLFPVLFIAGSSFTPPSGNEIKWMSYEEVIEASKKNPKKVFVDVYTNWCGWCKRMDQTTFRDADVVKLLNDDYYAVKLNAESDEKFEQNGETMSYRQLARSYKASGYPTTVYLNEDLSVIQAVPGYQKPQSLTMILSYFGGDHHLTTAWPDYQKQFNTNN